MICLFSCGIQKSFNYFKIPVWLFIVFGNVKDTPLGQFWHDSCVVLEWKLPSALFILPFFVLILRTGVSNEENERWNFIVNVGI